MTNPGQWSIDRLVEQCKTEIERFRKSLEHIDDYCYELFRRAFEDRNNEALASVYQVYYSFVMSWVHRHPAFDSGHMVDEYVVSDSMSQFIYNMRQKPLQDFPNVGAIMGYLKKCVHSAVIAERRQQERHQFMEQVPDVMIEQSTGGIERQLMSAEIWDRIIQVLDDDEDVLLARLVFLQDLPPRAITDDYPHLWSDTNSVRVARQRITRKLRRDPIMVKMFDRDSTDLP